MRHADKLETVPTDRLVPYARNARTHSPEQVAAVARSIERFGFTNPVLIDAEDGIVAGHGRVLAAKRLGMASVPCLRVGWLTEAEKRAYVLADNQLSLQAGWDDDLLAGELRDLQDDGFDLSLIGFADDELNGLLGNAAETGMPPLPSGEKSPFQQVTFTLHDSQAEEVAAALKAAKAIGPFIDAPNANSNGNALARICETYLTRHGDR